MRAFTARGIIRVDSHAWASDGRVPAHRDPARLLQERFLVGFLGRTYVLSDREDRALGHTGRTGDSHLLLGQSEGTVGRPVGSGSRGTDCWSKRNIGVKLCFMIVLSSLRGEQEDYRLIFETLSV